MANLSMLELAKRLEAKYNDGGAIATLCTDGERDFYAIRWHTTAGQVSWEFSERPKDPLKIVLP